MVSWLAKLTISSRYLLIKVVLSNQNKPRQMKGAKCGDLAVLCDSLTFEGVSGSVKNKNKLINY